MEEGEGQRDGRSIRQRNAWQPKARHGRTRRGVTMRGSAIGHALFLIVLLSFHCATLPLLALPCFALPRRIRHCHSLPCSAMPFLPLPCAQLTPVLLLRDLPCLALLLALRCPAFSYAEVTRNALRFPGTPCLALPRLTFLAE